MLVHLVATLALAGVACLSLWALYRRLGRPLPGYALAMAGACVAIGYGVYAEYSWAARMEGGLPTSFVVLRRVEGRSALSPWTWIVPRVERMSLVDTAAVRRNPAHPDLRLVDVLLLQRFNPVMSVPQLIDCAHGRRADVSPGGGLGADGLPPTIDWTAADEPLVRAVCGTEPPDGAPEPRAARDGSGGDLRRSQAGAAGVVRRARDSGFMICSIS